MNAPVPLSVIVRTADLRDARECARIDAFATETDGGTIFHRPQWSLAVERGCGQRAHYLVAERGGALIGCLPLTAIRSRLFGNAMVSAGFGTGGGIIGDGADRLADAAWEIAATSGCATVELRGGPVPDGWQ
ncbi:MAG: FemAB, partial [Sphingomonas sp.]